jgi:hypothetical protein
VKNGFLGLLILTLMVALTACGPHPLQPTATSNVASEVVAPANPTQPRFETTPLWEQRVSGSANWTAGATQALLTWAPHLIAGPRDVQDFCPTFLALTTQNRVEFLVYFISAVAHFESSFSPVSRYHETTMGTDTVTGLPVYSEGLLQLSYQDTVWAPFCEFDWRQDKDFAPTDPRKSILDPIKNLTCGIRILDLQVQKKGRLQLGSGAYWAVIKTDSAASKISEIKGLTRALPVCRYQM